MPKQQTEHSPTPFKVNCLGSEGYNIYPIHGESLSKLKAECGGTNDQFYDKVHPIARLEGDFYRQKANAEFIVKACNNHDKLVEALRESILALNDLMPFGDHSPNKVLKTIEQVLANEEL